MVDVPGTVSHLKVVASMGMAIADSNDPGEDPDLLPSNANVTLHAVELVNGQAKAMTKPIVAGGKIVPIGPIVCQMRDGILYAPDNGRAPAPTEISTRPLIVIDPMSTGLSKTGWFWQADFAAKTGEGWDGFPVPFIKATDDDGITVDLAKALLDPFAAGTPTTPIWLAFLGVGGNGNTTVPSNIPAAPNGTLALDYGQTPPFIYYQNGA